MGHFDYKQFYDRHRPHIHSPGDILFVTYRLAGSIPKETVREYTARKTWLDNEIARVRRATQGSSDPTLQGWQKRVVEFQRKWFMKFEDLLHSARSGPMWMKDERVAEVVAGTLHDLDGEAYRLDAHSVMSNHVHVVFKPLLTETELEENFDLDGHLNFQSAQPSLSRIMQSLKGRSARDCNRILGRNGQFWEHESFDHVIRRGKLDKVIKYVLNNPVKAGLVRDWRAWPWNYCRKELAETLSGSA